MGSEKGWGETKQRVIWQKELDGRDSIVRQTTGLDRSRLFYQNIFILVISRIPMFWHLAAERASLSSLSSSSTFLPFSVFYDICSFHVCIPYSTYSAVPYGGHFIIIIICERERASNNQTKNTHTTSCIITYSTFFHPHSPFPHGRVCFSLSPSPKSRVHLEFEEKKSCPTSKP